MADDEDVLSLKEHFAGRYATEADALADLDGVIERSELFRVYREVPGYYMASRPGREQKTARIDRLLVPGPKLRQAGWGITFGIEAKRSGEKLGPAVAQAIDYTWCVFRAGSTFLYPEWIFLWPLERQVGAIESVMAQNRIGIVTLGRRGAFPRLLFVQSSTVLLEIGADGFVECRTHLAATRGNKTGSR